MSYMELLLLISSASPHVTCLANDFAICLEQKLQGIGKANPWCKGPCHDHNPICTSV